MEFIAFDNLYGRAQNFFNACGKWFSGIAAVRQHIFNVRQCFFRLRHKRDSSGPIRDVCRRHFNAMRQSLGIYRDVPFDARDFLPRVISFFLCGIGIFDALGINDAKTCFLFPTIAYTGLSNYFFLMLPQGRSVFLLASHSISENMRARFSIWESQREASSIDSHF